MKNGNVTAKVALWAIACLMAGQLTYAAGSYAKHDEADAAHGSHAKTKTEKKVTPYPLDVCPVSGEKLGSMGKPFEMVHKGQTLKLCCKGCLKAFNKAPDKFLGKLDAAVKAQKAAGSGKKRDADQEKEHGGHDHGAHDKHDH